MKTQDSLNERLIDNLWDNVYWFARMLIASDKYGGVGADSKTMMELATAITLGLEHTKSEKNEQIAIDILQTTLKDILTKRWQNTKKINAVTELIYDLTKRLLSRNDFEVLALTCEKVIVPTNLALEAIPNDDRVFAESIAHALLENKGEQGLGTIINIWDDIGSYGSMKAERVQIVQCFNAIKEHLETINISQIDKDIILTSFCQEFERRVGQKRKGRAGRGVENVTSFILTYYNIKASHTPEHFTAGLEIDRWIRNKEGWYIGISCKRTLRERWKQAYTTDIDSLNRHKIKELWHVLTFDRDLSDDKLTEMGSHRAIVYLPDNSPRYENASKHKGMSKYVRPLTSFIKDLHKEVL